MLNSEVAKNVYALIDPLAFNCGVDCVERIDEILAREDGQLPKNVLGQLIELHDKQGITKSEMDALRSAIFFAPYPIFDVMKMLRIGFLLLEAGVEIKNIMLKIASIGEVERRLFPKNIQIIIDEIDSIIEDNREGYGNIELPTIFSINVINNF